MQESTRALLAAFAQSMQVAVSPGDPELGLTQPAMAVDDPLLFFPQINNRRLRLSTSGVEHDGGAGAESGRRSSAAPADEFTHRPHVDPNSQRLAARMRSSDELNTPDRLYALHEAGIAERSAKRAALAAEAMRECTFSPHIVRHSPTAGAEEPHASVVDRTHDWQRSIESERAKAEREKRDAADAEVAEHCTFAPLINTSRPTGDVAPPRDFDRFVTRLRHARDLAPGDSSGGGADAADSSGTTPGRRGRQGASRGGSASGHKHPHHHQPHHHHHHRHQHQHQHQRQGQAGLVCDDREEATASRAKLHASPSFSGSAPHDADLVRRPVEYRAGLFSDLGLPAGSAGASPDGAGGRAGPSALETTEQREARLLAEREAEVASGFKKQLRALRRELRAEQELRARLERMHGRDAAAAAEAAVVAEAAIASSTAAAATGAARPAVCEASCQTAMSADRLQNWLRRSGRHVRWRPGTEPSGDAREGAEFSPGSQSSFKSISGSSGIGGSRSSSSSSSSRSSSSRCTSASITLAVPKSSGRRAVRRAHSTSDARVAGDADERSRASQPPLLRLPSERAGVSLPLSRSPPSGLEAVADTSDPSIALPGSARSSGGAAAAAPGGAGSGTSGGAVGTGVSLSPGQLQRESETKMSHRREMEIAQKDVRFIMMKFGAAGGDTIKLRNASNLTKKCVDTVSALLEGLEAITHNDEERRKMQDLRRNMRLITRDAMKHTELLLASPRDETLLGTMNKILERLEDTVEFALVEGTHYAIECDLMETLRKVPMFSAVQDRAFLNDLIRRMDEESLAPGAMILRAGEVGDKMCFLTKGTADVLLEDGQLISSLAEGDFCGEIAVLIDTPRTASVRATSFVTVHHLTKVDLFDALQGHDDFLEHFKEVARDRLFADLQRRRAADLAQNLHSNPTYTLRGEVVQLLGKFAANPTVDLADELLQVTQRVLDLVDAGLAKTLRSAVKALAQARQPGSTLSNVIREVSLTGAEARRVIALDHMQQFLAKNHIFDDVDTEFRAILLSGCDVEDYGFGEKVVDHGAGVGTLFFISFGSTSLYMPMGERVGSLDEGAHIGERALLFDEPLGRTIKANTEVTLVKLSSAVLKEALKLRPQFAENLAAVRQAIVESEQTVVREVSRTEIEMEAKQLAKELDMLIRLAHAKHEHFSSLATSELRARRSLLKQFLDTLDTYLATAVSEA